MRLVWIPSLVFTACRRLIKLTPPQKIALLHHPNTLVKLTSRLSLTTLGTLTRNALLLNPQNPIPLGRPRLRRTFALITLPSPRLLATSTEHPLVPRQGNIRARLPLTTQDSSIPLSPLPRRLITHPPPILARPRPTASSPLLPGRSIPILASLP